MLFLQTAFIQNKSFFRNLNNGKLSIARALYNSVIQIKPD